MNRNFGGGAEEEREEFRSIKGSPVDIDVLQ